MYNGIVNVYKEAGYTSHDVVAKLRGIFGQKQIGHTGTLDPMAEGVLIILLGKATKLADLVIAKDKSYIASMKLGITTDTDDITGTIKKECDVNLLFGDLDKLEEDIRSIFKGLLGRSMQIPPMYSAIKINGKKLYFYARQGIEIERTPRPVEIYNLELLEIVPESFELRFRVSCSKGTYIRSLIRDIGDKLGVGATMSALLRDEINGLKSSEGIRIDDLERLKESGDLTTSILGMDEILGNIPAVTISAEGKRYLDNGNRLRESHFIDCLDIEQLDKVKKSDYIRVYSGTELRALYTFDNSKNDFKVYKML